MYRPIIVSRQNTAATSKRNHPPGVAFKNTYMLNIYFSKNAINWTKMYYW